MRFRKSFLSVFCLSLLVLPFAATAAPPATPATPATLAAPAPANDGSAPLPAEATADLASFLRYLDGHIPPGTEPGPGVFGDGCYGHCSAEITCNVNGTFQLLSCTGWSSCEEYPDEDLIFCDGTAYTCEQCFWTFQRTCEYC